MSCDQINIGGRCGPGVACPAPLALPSYTQACAPKIPMPVYQPVINPQQQFGVVGGPSTYTPPPAISYGSQYVCYNAGNQSYNQTIGTLASIIAGAIYSTPMNGGAMPGQLAAQGGSNPYAAYCPPGQDPNQYYQEHCATNPPGYCPQPYPNVYHPLNDGGSCGGRGGYKDCNPCGGPKAYEGMWDKKPGVDCEPPKKKECKESDQWEGKASGDTGTIKINDRYTIKLNEKDSSWELYDKCEKTTIKIHGDPHVDLDGDGKNDVGFKKDASFILEDGTKITVKTTDASYLGYPGATVSSELYITNGDESIVVKGLAQDGTKGADGKGNKAYDPDGNLKVTVSHTNGKTIDKLVDDGAFTAYQVGDSWVDGATGKFLSQSTIDNAESEYEGDDRASIKGSDKKDDKLKGTASDDTYIATEGLDSFDGKDGTDTAVFEGDIEDYKITRTADGTIIVKDEDGNVTRLKDVEKLKFNDETFTVVVGNENANNFVDKEGREIVFGKEGNDTFKVDQDNSEVDYFSGGDGTDTVKLSGKKEDYDFSKDSNGNVVVEDDNGKIVAILKDVENVQFGTGAAVALSTLVS